MSYLISLLLALAVRFGYLNKTGGMYYINRKRPTLMQAYRARQALRIADERVHLQARIAFALDR